ncbi:hypothetical protein AGMMS50225_21350 [Betaproteobacteria bacterium]|nr:hypothetical protein AGMMS50225_21350 [Betaproteobacteria bacterium]
MVFVRQIKFAALVAALLAFALPSEAMAQAGGAAPGTVYCCDVGGQPICGDILQTVCYGRAYREVSPQGIVRRHVVPPLTAEEIARNKDALRLKREAEEQALRQERLDRALLSAYSSIEELDKRRDYEMTSFDRAIVNLMGQERDLKERRKGLEAEVDALNGRPVPTELQESLRDVESEISTLHTVLLAKDQEREATRKRFDNDRRRYLDLSSATRNLTPSPGSR